MAAERTPAVDDDAAREVQRSTTQVQRSTSGVRRPGCEPVRWSPGARYRASRLAGPAQPPHGPALAGAGAAPAGSRTLPGRLFRGPALRRPVFERPMWTWAGGPRARTAAQLSTLVDRYRRGALDTEGLTRALGRTLAS